MTDVAGAWVKISPDLSTFREDLLAKLKTAMRGIDATIRVHADTGEAQAQVDTLAAKVTAVGKQTAAPKVKIEGTKQALADLGAVSSAVGSLNNQRATARVAVDGAAKALFDVNALKAALLSYGNLAATQYRKSGFDRQPNWGFGSPSIAQDRFGQQLALGWAGDPKLRGMGFGFTPGPNFNMPRPADMLSGSLPGGSMFDQFGFQRSTLPSMTAQLGAQAAAASADARAVAGLRDQLLALGATEAWVRTTLAGGESATLLFSGLKGGGGNKGPTAAALATAALWGGGGLFGLAGMGSLASFAGLGPERLLMTGIGLAGSAAGGLLGGGLLGAGILGKAGVGMGSNAVVTSSTIADTKTLYTDYNALTQAVATYGRNSLQASQAQLQLNSDMSALGNTVGVKAEFQLARLTAGVNSYWDATSGPARVAAVKVLTQGLGLVKSFIPNVESAATRNLGITSTGLKPLLAFLEGAPGKGAFTELENLFAKTLPTGMHALDQGAELFVKTIEHVAPMTGTFITKLDNFFTKYNSGAGLAKWMSDVDKLVADFRLWETFVKVLVRDIADLFSADKSHNAQAIVTYLTQALEKLGAWERSTAGMAQLGTIFNVHKNEILTLLPLVGILLQDLAKLYLTVAPVLTTAFTDVLKVVTTIVGALEKDPLASWVIAVGLIAAKLGVLGPALGGVKTALGFGGNTGLQGALATNTAAVQANTDALLGKTGSSIPGGGGGGPGGILGDIKDPESLASKLVGTGAVIGGGALAGYIAARVIFPSAVPGAIGYKGPWIGAPGSTALNPFSATGYAGTGMSLGQMAAALSGRGIGGAVFSGGTTPGGDVSATLNSYRLQGLGANQQAAQAALTISNSLAATGQITQSNLTVFKKTAALLQPAAADYKLAMAAIGAALAALATTIYNYTLTPAKVAGIVASVRPSLGVGASLAAQRGLASGGAILPGESAVVGEKGPELLMMTGSGGMVIPNHRLRFAAGGAYAPGSQLTSTAAALAYAQFTGQQAGGGATGTNLTSAQYALLQQAQTLLGSLQQVATAGLTPLQQLTAQLSATHMRALQDLVQQLRATHQVELVSLANQIVAATKQAQQALNQQLEINQLQALATQTTDIANAFAQMASDIGQSFSDSVTASATRTNDQANIASVTGANALKQISDASQLTQDQIAAKFQFGIALQAAEAKIALDKMTAKYDAAIGADQLRAAQLQAHGDALVAGAQANVDAVQKRTDAAVARAQQAYDKSLNGTNSVLQAQLQLALSRAQADQRREVAAAQAHLQAVQAQQQAVMAQANAVVSGTQTAAAIAEAKLQAYIDKLNAEVPGAQGIQVIVQATNTADPNEIAQEALWQLRLHGL